MNSRFELIKKMFPNEIEGLRIQLTNFLIFYVDLKEFLDMAFLEELLNERPLDVCPINFGAKCKYWNGICENCIGICQYQSNTRLAFFGLKIELKEALEVLYEKVKIDINFKKFFP